MDRHRSSLRSLAPELDLVRDLVGIDNGVANHALLTDPANHGRSVARAGRERARRQALTHVCLDRLVVILTGTVVHLQRAVGKGRAA